MSANELIEKWPGIAGAEAAAVFGRDAWAMPVGYNGNDATLVKDATRERDVIGLDVIIPSSKDDPDCKATCVGLSSEDIKG